MAFLVTMHQMANLVVVVSLFATSAFARQEDEIVTKRGKQYHDCHVTKIDKHGVTFRHKGGKTHFPEGYSL